MGIEEDIVPAARQGGGMKERVRVRRLRKAVLLAAETSRPGSTAGGPREQRMDQEDHHVVHLAAAAVPVPSLLSRMKIARMGVVER